MKYAEILETARKDLPSEQALKARDVQDRVNRYRNQCNRMTLLSSVTRIRLERKRIFELLDRKLPKPSLNNVFSIHNIARHSLPDRLLAERTEKS